jgi:hypothetical protein
MIPKAELKVLNQLQYFIWKRGKEDLVPVLVMQFIL